MQAQDSEAAAACLEARRLAGAGQLAEAIELYGATVVSYPSYAPAYADRGTAYALQKQYDLALDDLQRALMLGYQDGMLLCTIGNIHRERGHVDAALACYDNAAEVSASHPLVYYDRANLYAMMGYLHAAIGDFERCLSLQPEAALARAVKDRLQLVRSRLTPPA
jgi:tetratricopeptide (TPR) repeat protein